MSDLRALRALSLISAYDLYRHAAAADELVRWLDVFASESVIADRVGDAATYVAAALDARGYLVGTGYVNAVGYIGGIAVAEQRAGLGGAILDHLIQQCPGSEPWMSVWSGNEAMLALAKTRGFTSVAEDPDDRYLADLRFLILSRTDAAGITLLRPPLTGLTARA